MPHFSLFGGAGNGRPSSPKHQHHQDASGGKRWSYTTLAGLLSLLVVGYLAGTWHARLSPSGGRGRGPGLAAWSSSSSSSSSSCADADSGELNFTAAQHHSSGDTSSTSSSTTGGGGSEYYTGPFPACDASLSDYTPCEDTQRSMAFPRARLVYRERHCPVPGELLRCLVPAPAGYRLPFRWPRSRDEAWYANVPHKHLTVEKAVQNWIQLEGDRFRFPGGGTMFPHGAGAYIDEIDAVVKLRSGDVRTALDTGCGVASFGAYLLDRQVLTMSFAPRDTHEAQVQFALERGVPAMLLTMASMRLPYPARAFDLAHCSRCLIPWQDYDGLYLLEVDRVLRPGGHWILSGPPVNWPTHYQGWQRTQEDLKAEMDAIQDLAARMCWDKVAERGDLAVWRKPVSHQACKESKRRGLVPDKPAFCPAHNNPDTAWYTPMEACITELPEQGHMHVGRKAAADKLASSRWPARLTQVPPRIQTGALPSVTPESFRQDTELWRKRVRYYKEHLVGVLAEGSRYRNVMDMNAGLGGFAANLDQDKSWVMNAVPPRSVVSEIEEEDTLGVVYERGLIGTYQDWCEAFSTYPRTYDFIHADRLFTLYDNRCDLTYILLEMDRILRPQGAVLLRDHVDILTRVRRITSGMRWSCKLADHEDGPFNQEKILVCLKHYWLADPPGTAAAQAQLQGGDSTKPRVVTSEGGQQ